MPFLVLLVIGMAFWWPWQQGTGGEQALDIVRRRLASGEISVEEFERLNQLLQVSPGKRALQPPLLLALVLGLLLILMTTTMVLAWRSDDWGWGWGWGHMGWMMGGGRNTSGDPARQAGTAVTVSIEDYAYSPGNLRVPVGARVTWTNRDGAPHSATADDLSWDTGLFAKNESRTIAFDTPGTFAYVCSIHPAMKARLVVE